MKASNKHQTDHQTIISSYQIKPKNIIPLSNCTSVNKSLFYNYYLQVIFAAIK